MEIDWRISEEDVKEITDYIRQRSNTNVATRISRNIEYQDLHLNRDTILKSVLLGLLLPNQKQGSYLKIGFFFNLIRSPLCTKHYQKFRM